MKIINLDVVNEKIYYDKLDNGLEIYMTYDKDSKNHYACYLTNFGGLDTEFVPLGEKEMVKVPSGIAHFLEHKLFEEESGESVHEFYKKTGTYNNAMTDNKTTRYVFNGPLNFINNLEYLLKYVGSPYFTYKNVEKEKGIILEEESMTSDNPNRLFFETVDKNLFNTLPYYNKVIGTREDIKSITKEDLYKCYNTFYNPSNMVLFVSSNEKPEDIIDLVSKTVKKDNNDKIIKKEYEEKEEVRVKKEVIRGDVTETRVSYSIKMKLDDFNASKIEIYDYFSILFSMLIGNLSEFNFDLKKKKIIKDDIYYSVSFEKSKDIEYVIFNIMTLTNKTNIFIKLLEDKLINRDYNKDDFNLFKKEITQNLIESFNSNSDKINYMVNTYLFNKKINNELIIEEKNLNYKRFIEVTDKLKVNNKSIVVMKK